MTDRVECTTYLLAPPLPALRAECKAAIASRALQRGTPTIRLSSRILLRLPSLGFCFFQRDKLRGFTPTAHAHPVLLQTSWHKSESKAIQIFNSHPAPLNTLAAYCPASICPRAHHFPAAFPACSCHPPQSSHTGIRQETSPYPMSSTKNKTMLGFPLNTILVP